MGDHEDGLDGDEGDGNGWSNEGTKRQQGQLNIEEDGQGKGREEGVHLKGALKNRIICFTYKAKINQDLTDLVNINLAKYKFGSKLVD